MPGKNYMQDNEVSKYYNQWIHGATLFDHPLDRERFFKFVKACINYVGKGNTLGSTESSLFSHLFCLNP